MSGARFISLTQSQFGQLLNYIPMNTLTFLKCFECHRKVKQNENLCYGQSSGSMPLLKVTTGVKGPFKRRSRAIFFLDFLI